jgi:NADP-dependent 3-hydroxy acid dehydrogenase YdfG
LLTEDRVGLLTEKVVVVTGATSGIGAELSRRLYHEGATVIGVGRRADVLAAEETRGEGRFIGIATDLADADARPLAIEAIAAYAPRIHLLVNNAGETTFETPLELGYERWRHLWEVNLHAAIELSLALAPRIEPGGSLINVSSITARMPPNVRFAAYAATKGALDRVTEALRMELDPRHVRVSSIAPGLVDTPIYDNLAGFADTRAKISRQVPQWLSPGDVADAIVWMASRPPHVVISELVILPSGQGR